MPSGTRALMSPGESDFFPEMKKKVKDTSGISQPHLEQKRN